MSIPAARLADLIANFSGPVVTPDHPEYDQVRTVHNGFVDKRPACIVRCRGVADVIAAVKFARAHNTPAAIRGGGHNVSGRALVEGGLVIDLSLMKGVAVDSRQRTARAQGGVTWGEFNRETQVYGLATTGGVVSSTGIAGLTLGGGLGWLMGRHGMVVDNLRSVELVTAGGEVWTVSADQRPDLFWALRGGGGNFGIAASLEYQLHPVGPMIYGGPVFHAFTDAEKVLRFYRDFTRDLPDDLTAFAALVHSPDGAAKLAGIVTAHCGPADEAEKALRPLKSFGTPVMDAIGPIPYSQVNMLFDPALPRGARNYWKSSFLTDLTDSAIRALVDAYSNVTSPMSALLLEHVHGAATREAADATAFPHRSAGYNMLVLSQWTNATEDQRHISWARTTYDALQPFRRDARYMNYLDDDDATQSAAAAAAYGANYARLQQIKAKYDPDNFFRQNLNIEPAEGTAPRRPPSGVAAQDTAR